MLDPLLETTDTPYRVHLSKDQLLGIVRIYLDAAGAHMHPACSHSDLWRCTRPMPAVVRAFYRSGHWPQDLRPYAGKH